MLLLRLRNAHRARVTTGLRLTAVDSCPACIFLVGYFFLSIFACPAQAYREHGKGHVKAKKDKSSKKRKKAANKRSEPEVGLTLGDWVSDNAQCLHTYVPV